MTTILAIETSTELASAALLVDDQIYVRELSGVQTHSQGILPALQSLLSEAGIALSDCDVLAYGCGPGAFTGIRTACGIVQGLAYGVELNVVPVVSLQAMALAAFAEVKAENFICVLDARMSEVYWAQYCFVGGVCVEVSAPVLAKIEDITPSADLDSPYFVLGNGVVLPSQFIQFSSIPMMPHAKQVAELAKLALASGQDVSPELAQPLYLRNKIALTTAERALVQGQK
ncbi:tRNA (adenosine(37)-N6)-threonylcarbamoyltransferase complex dimerization subunit type 1 TsaB [Undibacterium sp. 14-3-2]|jgi:tRNA threonylcarbamoyladenosine biosynthesis protein TsaB|uniref:tRNA (adenosine(37)-N6)-threonylcarbamoyltransferase complex dimerization subunit type 1 TsaB n=1 Tax=Undibacterium sp. 14-3-2 TaxID=2800129 RepID=UPI001903DF88|nr:tRNA (adenosine(37)-N6)-threonylcarbamoyltransferase complex dimerization subunit type 1 TsaB [Undibacterium sp. 14-3-2]MBK1891428.1 tRNA (adenosine(37)-N6)-threonylcarbamoyltransferase complex dimerization subunit type 1 TsaB [Undibacterium sp. 14-3-2]